MNLTIHQNITIHNLRIEGITNSSVLQIGSAGIIKAQSNLYNTGGYTGPAPLPKKPGEAQPSPPPPGRRPVGPPYVPFRSL